jgi:hypothetical protein
MIGEAGQKTHRMYSQELKIEITATTKNVVAKGTIARTGQKTLK